MSESLEAPLVNYTVDEEDEEAPAIPTKVQPAGKRRYFIMFMCFLGLMLVYCMRVDLSVAILTMDPQYRWDQMADDPKGFVLSSFYIGYIIGQIPGGIVATKFGGNLVFGIGVLATGVFTMLLPLATCGSFTCPSYSTVAMTSADYSCGVPGQDLMPTYFDSNKTLSDCYRACLGSCIVRQQGEPPTVCATDYENNPQKCTANCTLDTFCDYFFYNESSDSSDDNDDQTHNTCLLFSSCADSNHTEVAMDGTTYELVTESYISAVVVLRILMGLFESVTYPSFFALLSKWAPASERSGMVGLACGGAYFGTAIAFPICSSLVASTAPVIGRWPGMFYLFGVMTLFWAVGWFAVVRKSPEADRNVSAEELNWIVSTRKDDVHINDTDSSVDKKEEQEQDSVDSDAKERPTTCWQTVRQSIWMRMFLCPASLVIFGVHFAGNWINYTLLSFLPTYFANQLDFDISSSGLLEVIPYVTHRHACCVPLINSSSRLSLSVCVCVCVYPFLVQVHCVLGRLLCRRSRYGRPRSRKVHESSWDAENFRGKFFF